MIDFSDFELKPTGKVKGAGRDGLFFSLFYFVVLNRYCLVCLSVLSREEEEKKEKTKESRFRHLFSLVFLWLKYVGKSTENHLKYLTSH